MRGTKRKFESSILVLWIIAYVILLVLPLCTNLLEYTIFSHRLEEQITERNTIALDAIRSTIDEQLLFLESLSYNVSLNRDVRKIATEFSQPLDSEEKMYIYSFVQDFEYMFGMRDYTDRVFIYFKELDLMAKSCATQTFESFYNTYLFNDGVSCDERKEFYGSYHIGDYFVLDFDKRKNEIFYIKTIPLNYSDTTVNIIFNFNKDYIEEKLEELYLFQSGRLDILDKDGNSIVRIGKRDYEEQLLTYEKQSTINGWQYVYNLPKNEVYKEITYSKIIIAFTIVGGFLICLCLAFWFLKFNYCEIKRMISYFSKDSGLTEDDIRNEYFFLSKKIESSLLEKQKLNAELNIQNQLLRESILVALLEGKEVRGERRIMELERIMSAFESDEFLTVLLVAEKSKNDEVVQKHFIIDNIFSQFLRSRSYIYHTVMLDECMAYIICLNDKQKQEYIADSLRFTYEFIAENFNFAFYGAIGGVHRSRNGIAKSYREAKKTLDYETARKCTEIGEYSRIKGKLLENSYYTGHMEEQLIALIKGNRKEELRSTLEELFSSNQRSGEPSIDSTRHLASSLFRTVKKFMLPYGMAAEQVFAVESQYIDNIAQQSSVDEIKELIISVFMDCYDRTMNRINSKEDLVDRIILYIRQNYSNQDMSLQLVADAFSMSRDYTAKKFKEKTQIRLNDYINAVRVEKAKEYLGETNHLISEIAEDVGFSNYRTFVRIFTNVTGVSPKQYRQMTGRENGGNEA